MLSKRSKSVLRIEGHLEVIAHMHCAEMHMDWWYCAHGGIWGVKRVILDPKYRSGGFPFEVVFPRTYPKLTTQQSNYCQIDPMKVPDWAFSAGYPFLVHFSTFGNLVEFLGKMGVFRRYVRSPILGDLDIAYMGI